jgi:hypothetical protein
MGIGEAQIELAGRIAVLAGEQKPPLGLGEILRDLVSVGLEDAEIVGGHGVPRHRQLSSNAGSLGGGALLPPQAANIVVPIRNKICAARRMLSPLERRILFPLSSQTIRAKSM